MHAQMGRQVLPIGFPKHSALLAALLHMLHVCWKLQLHTWRLATHVSGHGLDNVCEGDTVWQLRADALVAPLQVAHNINSRSAYEAGTHTAVPYPCTLPVHS